MMVLRGERRAWPGQGGPLMLLPRVASAARPMDRQCFVRTEREQRGSIRRGVRRSSLTIPQNRAAHNGLVAGSSPAGPTTQSGAPGAFHLSTETVNAG